MIKVNLSYFKDCEAAEFHYNETEAEIFEVLDDIVIIKLGDEDYYFYTKKLAQALKPFIK